MKQTISVLISDGDGDYALFAAHCLAQYPNVKIYVLCEKPWSPIRFSRYCHLITRKLSDRDDQTILSILAEIVKKHKIDVLLPTGIHGISFAIAHREALAKFVAIPPLPDRRSFEIANNKWLLAQFLEENHIPGPKTVLLTQNLLEQGLTDLEYPVLLKPTGAAGGIGVKRFESATDLRGYLETQDLEKVQDCFVLQAFLSGPEIDFSVLSVQGKNVATTIQRGIIARKKKYAPPAAIEFIKDERFFEASRQLFAALHWSGYAHVDTIGDPRDNSINILDINPRFWGSLRGSLVAGVNFPYLACLSALQIPFPPPDYELTHYYNAKTVVRERLFRRSSNGSNHKIPLRETGIRFLLNDPLAEMMRTFQQ